MLPLSYSNSCMNELYVREKIPEGKPGKLCNVWNTCGEHEPVGGDGEAGDRRLVPLEVQEQLRTRRCCLTAAGDVAAVTAPAAAPALQSSVDRNY